MNRRPILSKALLVGGIGAFLGLTALLAVGCKGPDDAPTNTKNSQYMGGGDTAADKIGAERAKARLPHGGAQSGQ